MTKKRAVERDKEKLALTEHQAIHKVTKENFGDKNMYSGVHCTNMIEPLPNYIEAECERVISHKNCYIVMGRDRPGQRDTGYAGSGDTQAHSIDVVVGRMAEAPDSNLFCDPDFHIDAARMYISQKADIDDYFNIAPGSEISKAKSAIGLKADAVRVISREGMKLIAGHGTRNSQGGNISDSLFGVDIIANNNDADLQPIPKGKNLAEAIERLAHHCHKLNGVIEGILAEQDKMNKAIQNHWHISTTPGKRTSPSFAVMYAGIVCQIKHLVKSKTSLRFHRFNLESFMSNYLKEGGSKYINSRHNKVN